MDKYIEICEELGWSWNFFQDGDPTVELGKYSPAGEDFNFRISGDDFVKNVKKYADGFDEDEHIEMWIEARKNKVAGIPSTKELVKDAEAIKGMLNDLATALEEVD